MSAPSAGFAAAFAEGDPATLASRCLEQLSRTEGATLGILYVNEPAGRMLPALAREFAAKLGIGAWVGGVGLGVCAAGREVHDMPAVAVMTAALPPDRF